MWVSTSSSRRPLQPPGTTVQSVKCLHRYFMPSGSYSRWNKRFFFGLAKRRVGQKFIRTKIPGGSILPINFFLTKVLGRHRETS